MKDLLELLAALTKLAAMVGVLVLAGVVGLFCIVGFVLGPLWLALFIWGVS